jgi:cellulose synthase/poly-beta-1,6-N-acetylglucosamine synthase-like glycosyltransferase
MPGGLLTLYFAVLGSLALLGVHRLWLVARAVRRVTPDPPLAANPVPVLIQLPIYDEAFVVERLLRAAARIRHVGPVTIQVLDDSTDETRRVVDRVSDELRGSGSDVQVIRRGDRAGYKAGALARGLEVSDHPLIAIFDADFVPPPDFLERTVGYFAADERCALVQARWGHANRTSSLLTRAQAIFLDGHFAIEHRARSSSGRFFNFNGTAGVWRRSAITDAGGWTADTVTEDLDLSYRAQLRGWRFAYVDDLVAPAELPESWAAFRSQQSRWVRGGVETARKHLVPVLRSAFPIGVRADAAIHLTHNLAYVAMAILACLLPAAVVLRDQLGWRVPGGQSLLSLLDLTTLTAGTCAMFVFYAAAAIRTDRRLTPGRAIEIVYALCVGAGMSLSNSLEALAGLASSRSEFVRTPKRGDSNADRSRAMYRARVRGTALALEALFTLYFAAAVGYAIHFELFGALPFLLLYLVGFGSIVLGHLREFSSGARRTVVSDPRSSTATPARPGG